jgi:mannose-6-phosphate isomerase-like protein (cupin superfamily)
VLELGERVQSADSATWIEIVDRADGRLSFERNHAPGTGKADAHYHLDFTQTWEALSGEGLIEVDGETRELKPGAPVVLAPGTRHRDPWLPGEGELRIRGSFDPCTEFIERFAEVWGHHLRQGSADRQDQIPLLQILVIEQAVGGESYAAAIPRSIQKATLPLIAAFGRLRGYRPSYD